ncbi:MAG: tyrosine-type recombinase/integrase [Bacteroidales bacterium]
MIEHFLQYLQCEKRNSLHTIRAYRTDLNQLVDYLGEQDLCGLNYRDLRAWFSGLMEQGLSSSSVNRKIASVNAFFIYLLRVGKISQNPIEKIATLKCEKRLPFFYKEKQIHQVLDSNIAIGYEEQRNRTILELLYGTGIRLSELVKLRIQDVDLNAKTVRVNGKGNKQRLIPVGGHLWKVLSDYENVRADKFTHIVNDAYFCTERGASVYSGLVYRVVRQTLGEFGVVGKKSPHILRHSFATHMLNNGAELNSIKDLLGHSSLSATQVYTHNDIEKLIKSYHDAHPYA